MTIDETVYIAKGGSDMNSVAALGLKMANWHDCLVGLYLYPGHVRDAQGFIGAVLERFGEANLYAHNGRFETGLGCKMHVAGPVYEFVGAEVPAYKALKRKLLEIRVSNPKPFIGLAYDDVRERWTHHLVLGLGYLHTHYSYLPMTCEG